MSRRPVLLVLGALVASAVLAPAPPAAAKDDIASRQYQENKLVGFRFRPMNEWSEVPGGTDPDDPSIGGYYCDKGKFNRTDIRPTCEVYAFKRKSESVSTGEEGPGGPDIVISGMGGGNSTMEVLEKKRNFAYERAEQLLARMSEKDRRKIRGRNWKAEPETKEFKAPGARDGKGTLVLADYVVPTTIGTIVPAKIVVSIIENDEYEVGILYWIPEEEWRRFGRGLIDSATSLEFLEREKTEEARKELDESLSGAKTEQERWLALIKSKVVKGWDHVQTENYLLIFDKEVKPDRVRQMAREIEAIRASVYEVLFPPDEPFDDISVVRICKDKDQYHQYGGPGGSAGYWSWPNRELVFYEDEVKADSLRVLYHEAFHQYIFYSVGNISPHSWFNEGHGDYFSGHNYDPGRKRFVADRFAWRQTTVKNLIATDRYVPLKQFVTYSQQQYYQDGGNNYSQGWSLIYFLRETRNPEWKNILPVYFDTLKAEVRKWKSDQAAAEKAAEEAGVELEEGLLTFIPPDVEKQARQKALDAAFGDFDDTRWEKLEREWKSFKY